MADLNLLDPAIHVFPLFRTLIPIVRLPFGSQPYDMAAHIYHPICMVHEDDH